MSRINTTAEAIGEMLLFFLPYCSDQSTLLELKEMVPNFKQWREAHKLFQRIRNKTLEADKTNARLLQYQYSFEEICAKTLYNLADHHEGFSEKYLPPFDEDSPFWVIPIAVQFANAIGIRDLQSISSLLRMGES
jgi:hypothetical protein